MPDYIEELLSFYPKDLLIVFAIIVLFTLVVKGIKDKFNIQQKESKYYALGIFYSIFLLWGPLLESYVNTIINATTSLSLIQEFGIIVFYAFKHCFLIIVAMFFIASLFINIAEIVVYVAGSNKRAKEPKY